MAARVITPPAAEPVTLAEARSHTAQNTTDNDDNLIALIVSARERAEVETGRAIPAQTFEELFDCFPSGSRPIVLSKSPLFAVSSIAYVDANGDSQTLSSALYAASTSREPGSVAPVYGQVWPTARDQPDAVTVRYVAGWPCTSVAAGISSGSSTVTPGSMAGIKVGTVLVIDGGSSRESVVVTAVAATTFTATFARSHDAGAKVCSVPDAIQSAIKIILADLNANREGETEIPAAARSLLLNFWTGSY